MMAARIRSPLPFILCTVRVRMNPSARRMTMTIPRTVECNLSLSRDRRGNPLAIQTGVNRVPRVARLLALAVRMEGLIRAGGIADYSSVGQLGHVSRAR